MFRIALVVCAGISLILAMAGCATFDVDELSSFFMLQRDTQGKDRLVAGSIDAVATSTQNTLVGLGFHVASTREGDSIRLQSQTAHGNRFCLVLTREKDKVPELTRIHFEWESGRDEQTTFQIMSRIDGAAKK